MDHTHFLLRERERLGAVLRFDDTGHSFLTDGDHPILSALVRPIMNVRYDPAVAEEAWSRIFAFFERHL